jgi:hypothetical protein
MNDTAAKTAAAPPALPAQTDARGIDIGRPMSLALRLWLDEAFFNHASRIALQLSKSNGFVPKHLLGNVASCFAVVEKALVWNLSPSAVAACTYETPGGRVGYEGKLCHAILEASGHLEGGINYELYGTITILHKNGHKESLHTNDPRLDAAMRADGAKVVAQKDWSFLQGKFELKRSPKGTEYMAPTWTQKDAEGLGVTVSAQVKGETEIRKMDFDLTEAWPRNSTLWATAPHRQIKYTAVRAFGNHVLPALLMGVPFDDDDSVAVGFERAKDVTPRRPQRSDFAGGTDATGRTTAAGPTVTDVAEEAQGTAAEPGGWEVVTVDGQLARTGDPEQAAATLMEAISEAAALGEPQLQGVWETNAAFMAALRESGQGAIADSLNRTYSGALEEIDRQAREAARIKGEEEARRKAEAEKPKPAESAKAPEAHPQGQGAAQPAAGAAQAAASPQGEAAQQGEPAAPQPRQPAKPSLPRSPLSSKRHTDWPAWVETFLRLIKATEPSGVGSLYNQFLAEIEFCKESRTGDYERIMAAFDERRG